MAPKLRALAKLLVFVALVGIVFPAKKQWLRAWIPGDDDTAVYVADRLVELGAVLGFSWLMSALERRPFGAFGMPWRVAFRAEFWKGAVVGVASLTLLVLSLCATGALELGLPSASAPRAIGFGLGYAALFAVLAVREEFVYRGYGLFTLTGLASFWPAAIASTAWFAWSHSGNSSETPLGLANVAVFGLLACLSLRRTGNLWIAIGFHATWDWGQTYLYGVGDSGHAAAPGHLFTATVSTTAPPWLSGGSVGPEGSVLCGLTLLLLFVVCTRFLRGVRYPVRSESGET